MIADQLLRTTSLGGVSRSMKELGLWIGWDGVRGHSVGTQLVRGLFEDLELLFSP